MSVLKEIFKTTTGRTAVSSAAADTGARAGEAVGGGAIGILAVALALAGLGAQAVEVTGENTIGLLAVDSGATNIAIAVAWEKVGTTNAEAMVAADMLADATIETGDQLYVYNPDTGSYDTWLYDEGEWGAVQKVTDSGVSAGAAADSYALDRGMAAWLVSSASRSGRVYEIGQVAESAIDLNDLVAASGVSMIGNPAATNFYLNAITGTTNDYIRVGLGDGLADYVTYNEASGKWEKITPVYETKTIRGKSVTVQTGATVEDDLTLAPGEAVWVVKGKR